jgi:hypothetical protein
MQSCRKGFSTDNRKSALREINQTEVWFFLSVLEEEQVAKAFLGRSIKFPLTPAMPSLL